MSEILIAAIISLISGILGAIIQAYATIKSAQISALSKGRSRQRSKTYVYQIKNLIASRGMWLGVVIGLIASGVFIFTSPKRIDLGSVLHVTRSEPTITPGSIRIYSHYPARSVQYTVVFPDNELQKVESVCFGVLRFNISDWFAASSNTAVLMYYSIPFSIPEFCRVDFTVYDTNGEFIGIEIWASYIY